VNLITTIFGKRWRVRFVPASELPKPRDRDGDCVVPETPADKVPCREIRIYDKLRGREMLETLIHEVGHATWPEKREEWIEHHAADLARFLWRIGYRRKGHDAD
jgi:hypothetical protein